MPASHDTAYDAKDMARELMMPVGEPAVAVIGACLLLAMVWFLGSGHFAGATAPAHAAAARPSLHESLHDSLHATGGPIAPPAAHRFAG
jgi:hypothetical protein